MNALRILFIFALVTMANLLSAQPENPGNLQFKLEMIETNTWGVFVQPDETIMPSNRTTAGSGQVTIVAPVDFNYSNLESHGGTWVENARVNGPVEASGKAYISFGFVTDNPKINLIPNEETLLFTFTTTPAFNGTFQLIENENDPFATPNSYGTNPGNDLGMIDFGVQGGLQYYTYGGNISNGVVNAQPALATHQNNASNRRAKAVLAKGSEGTASLKPE